MERIRKMSAKTNQGDLNRLAISYLQNLGAYDRKKKVGVLEIWCRYEGGKCVQAGATKESVQHET